MINPDNPAGDIHTPAYMQLRDDLAACRQERGRMLKQTHTYHVNRDTRMLHPKCRMKFEDLQSKLHRSNVHFRLFEGYRSPIRQNYLFNQRPPVTKAGAWESAHQYGCAADFVWFEHDKWDWGDEHPWNVLGEMAVECGLSVPITWDRGHVEAIGWQRFIG